MNEAKLLAELARVAQELQRLDDRQMDLFDRRLELLVEARGLVPPVVWTRLAEVSGVTGAALKQQLRRAGG